MNLEYKNIDNRYYTIRQVLKQEFNIANRFISRLKQEKAILLNNEPMYIDKKLTLNDIITVKIDFEEEKNNKIVPIKMNLDILYEDDCILIINKPPFMPVHPSSAHFTDTLSNGVQYYFDLKNTKHKVRLVNRLDMNTSGIVVFAKNSYIQEILISQMKNKTFHKEYIALVQGFWKYNKGTINAPIKRKENSIIERIVSPDGDIAITHFEKQQQYAEYSLIKFLLETGRTHQIRVHCQYVGNPILGDTLYGTSSGLINRQALHAYKISFIHPLNNKNTVINAPIPEDIRLLISSNLI